MTIDRAALEREALAWARAESPHADEIGARRLVAWLLGDED